MSGVTKKIYKVGIFGSSGGDYKSQLVLADKLGKALSAYPCTIITGASSGLPYYVALAAHKNNKQIFGYSPVLNLIQQRSFALECDLRIYTKIYYIPKNAVFRKDLKVCQKYRNVISTSACDAGIIISGRWGTINEFSNLFDMGKVIGVLLGSGGAADEIPELLKKISKPSLAIVLFSKSPKMLVSKIFKELYKRFNERN